MAKASYAVPGTHAIVSFPPRRDGVVTVAAKLPLWPLPVTAEVIADAHPHHWLAVRMRVHRAGLRAFFRRDRSDYDISALIVPRIRHALDIGAWSAEQKGRGPRARRRQRVIRVFTPHLQLAILVERQELIALARWLAAAGDEHWMAARTSLSVEISLGLFPPELREWVVTRRPRGRFLASHRVARYARAALWFAERLLLQATEQDGGLRNRIADTLGEPFPSELSPALLKRIVVNLVIRGFAPVEIGHDSGFDDASRVLSHHLTAPRRRRLERDWQSLPPPERVMSAWAERLLGAPGQISRDFGLEQS